jgi:hypothetical protein
MLLLNLSKVRLLRYEALLSIFFFISTYYVEPFTSYCYAIHYVQEFKANNDEEAAILAASRAASTVIDAANAIEVSR